MLIFARHHCTSEAKGAVVQEWQKEDPSEALLCILLSVPASAGDDASSWCGGLEQDIVRDAPNPREGAKARRKRKRVEQQQDKDAPAGPKAQWASSSAQLAAYRYERLRCTRSLQSLTVGIL